MTDSRHKRLLSDVLAEETDAGFREALLHQTLHFVRRRQQLRKVRQIVCASAVVAFMVFITFHFLTSKPLSAKRSEGPYTLVTTFPLPASAIVSTIPNTTIPLITSSPTVGLVATSSGSAILHELDDDQLLALLPSPALLVRRGSHLADLVFADPKAEQALLRN